MKILMINVVCGVKSTGRICTDLARCLEEQGHEVKIAFGRENVPEQYEDLAVRIGETWSPYVHGVKALILDGAGLGSALATKAFIRWIREYDPDVIHLHNLHGYYIHVPLLFAYLKESRKKVIWTLHDMWPFTGHSAACDQADCERWRTGCGSCPLKEDYPRAVTDFSRRNWKWKKETFSGLGNMTLVSPSRWLAGLTEQSFLGAYPVKVIPNGIDTGAFCPMGDGFKEEKGIDGKKMILGVAGNWHDRRKGFPDFLKLAERLPEEYVIVMVGLDESLKQQLPGNIIGMGKTDSVQQLARVYSAADVLLNPTYSDNYPTVNLEALCCGTPVLSYRTGGSPESIGEGCGAAAEQGNLDEVMTLLPKCCAMKQETTRKAELHRQQFSKERAKEAYMALY